ncbi:MAG: peptide deformylase [bacterium]|nr:peptide deformylase [bacterium]
MSEIKPIVKEPDQILRAKAKDLPIKDITSRRIKELISGMKKALKNTPDGVGLAAPQVGESLRIFIVSEEAEEIDRLSKEDLSSEEKEEKRKSHKERDWKYYVFINPLVKNKSRTKVDGPEGCLSVPGKYGDVHRMQKITVEAHDEHGKKFTRGASNFFARVIQHELDHLEGTLFIDKAKNLN